MKRKDEIVKYATALATALVIAAAVFYLRGGFSEPNQNEVIKYLSDAFFVPAVLYVGFGLLCVAAGEGVLDIIGYGFQSLLYLFTPARKDRAVGGYYEYKVRKKEKRKPVPVHVLHIGILLLLPALIFSVLYS